MWPLLFLCLELISINALHSHSTGVQLYFICVHLWSLLFYVHSLVFCLCSLFFIVEHLCWSPIVFTRVLLVFAIVYLCSVLFSSACYFRISLFRIYFNNCSTWNTLEWSVLKASIKFWRTRCFNLKRSI